MSAAPFFDLNNVYTFARDITRIADHIPAEMCDGPSVHYYRALTAASAAAAVAAGGIKPESTPTWSPRSGGHSAHGDLYRHRRLAE